MIDFINQNFFFLFILCFSFFSYIRFMYAQKNIFLLSLFFLPATFFHELSHFLFGLVTFAVPTSFNLLPKKENNYYTLGSVNFKNVNFFNAFLVGIAPVSLLVLIYFLDRNNFYLYKKVLNIRHFNCLDILLLSYINFIFVYSGIPSVQDFKVIFSKKLGLLFWVGIAILIGFYFCHSKLIDMVIALKKFF